MDALTNNFSFWFIPTAIVLIIIWNIFLHFQLWQIKKKLKIFFNGKNASDLEGVLFETVKRLKQSEQNIQKIFESLETLKKLTNRSIKKVSVVRFNPFQGTGGNQSFVVALLDSYNNGLILSSLYTREGTRVYSKPIEKGQSPYPLSKEEIEALAKLGITIKNG